LDAQILKSSDPQILKSSILCFAVDYPQLVARLEHALKAPLPGTAAHAPLAPRPRRQWPDGFDVSTIRQAAALLPVFPVANQAYLLLTVRARTLERHGGQVSMPGGVIDPGETVEQAALREAHEEIGLEPKDVRVLGALTPVDIPVSGFRLYPVVAALDRHPVLSPSDHEVAAILEIALDDLLDPGCLRTANRIGGGRTVIVPAFHVADHEIWGATALVLSEVLTLVGEVR